MVHYFISQVKRISQRPTVCVNCGNTQLKEDAVLATVGPSEKDGDYAPSVLCLSCETLMIVSNLPSAVVGIFHSVGNQVTVRGT
ncbi:MAG: hypothetical protein R3230_02190 [Nitrosopumilaceae archaeon]|nr:hypothetical protein [Nitrosopumilaceae archaeon]